MRILPSVCATVMFLNLQTTQKARLCVILYTERGAFYLLWRIGVQWSGVCVNNLPALTNERARALEKCGA
jgi:hypothetical protein